MVSGVGLMSLLLMGVSLWRDRGRQVGGRMRTAPTETRTQIPITPHPRSILTPWCVRQTQGLFSTTPHRWRRRSLTRWGLGSALRYTLLIVAVLLGVVGVRAQQVTDVRAQEVAPGPPHALQAAQELLALSYPELRASGLAARAVSTPAGIVMEFAERGPAVADLVARTAPRPAQLTATVTLDAAGRVRHLVCRGAWTGLERSRAVTGTTRAGLEARLTTAQARFGGAADEDVQTEVRRLLDRHGLKGMRINSAVLQEAQGTVLWVTHGATAAGESLAVHLEPLTGKLIAFHVGGER